MGVSNNYPTKKEAKTPYLLRDGCPDGLPGSGTITNLPLCCDHAGRLHLIHFDLCRPHPRRQNEERLPHGALYHLNWNQPLSQHRQHHKSHRQRQLLPGHRLQHLLLVAQRLLLPCCLVLQEGDYRRCQWGGAKGLKRSKVLAVQCAASVKQIFNIMSLGPNCPFYWVDTSDARQCAVGPLICCQSTNVIVIIVKRNHCTKHVFETPFHEALFLF